VENVQTTKIGERVAWTSGLHSSKEGVPYKGPIEKLLGRGGKKEGKKKEGAKAVKSRELREKAGLNFSSILKRKNGSQ